MKRIDKLKSNHLKNFEVLRKKHSDIMKEICRSYYTRCTEKNPVLATAGMLKCFANEFPTAIQEEELLVGTDWHWLANDNTVKECNVLSETNIGHFIADYEYILDTGISKMIEKAMQIKETDEKIKQNKAAYITALQAFCIYIKRYANQALAMANIADSENDKKRLMQINKDCNFIAENRPKTFRQALQLIWFIQIFLETEACSAAISMGRIDQYMYPFYKDDIENGTITKADALELIMCLYIKFSEGDESTMITLGGLNNDGKCADNELTILFLEAQIYLCMRQPSICVRTNKKTSAELWKSAENLAKMQCGMPAYFNDERVIAGLKNIGIESEDANDYGIVGCYEASPQGAFSNTVMSGFNLYDSFDEFLNGCNEYTSFSNFFSAYKEYFEQYYSDVLINRFKQTMSKVETWASPFAGCCLRGSFQSGCLPEQYGCKYTMFGLNILGIGILIDSIYTIKKLVFEKKSVTLQYLYEQSKDNFSDKELFEKIKELNESYGSNTAESNLLANELSKFIGEVVLSNKINEKVLVSPALFQFRADIFQRKNGGTINGRKSGELLSYGIMPCATPHTHHLTSVLLSSARVFSEYFPNGCPLMITLSPTDMNKEQIITALIKTYFDCGGFHFAINITDSETLENAQKNPQQFCDLTVKISGFSAKYVTLSKETQDALIERAKKGF